MQLEQTVVVGGELAVRFSDGVEIYLSLPYLRANCPCAECQQKRDDAAAAGWVAGGVAAADAALSAVDVVGGYAVRLVWGDGHAGGIYTFELLRKLDGWSRGAAASATREEQPPTGQMP